MTIDFCVLQQEQVDRAEAILAIDRKDPATRSLDAQPIMIYGQHVLDRVANEGLTTALATRMPILYVFLDFNNPAEMAGLMEMVVKSKGKLDCI